jgi:hypothetical protein
MSFDPAMRAFLNDRPSYVAPQPFGEVMRAGAIGQVVESRAQGFAPDERAWNRVADRGSRIERIVAPAVSPAPARGEEGSVCVQDAVAAQSYCGVAKLRTTGRRWCRWSAVSTCRLRPRCAGWCRGLRPPSPTAAQGTAELTLRFEPAAAELLLSVHLSAIATVPSRKVKLRPEMQADYASLIEKQQLESLRMIGEAGTFARKLLAVNPDAADAYLTLGTANYIIGRLPALKRFLLRLKGISGDKAGGMQQLEIAATHGHYLRPFAKIILALAAMREKKTALARVQLAELVAEFQQNPLFVRELAKLGAPSRK